MKKNIIIIILSSFMLIGDVKAVNIEEQLANLKNDMNELKAEFELIKDSRLDKSYPIGSIYISTVYSTPSEVSNAIGGAWEVYGSGRTLFGVNTNDANFNTIGKTGGISTTTLVSGNLPSHTHSIPALSGTAASAGAHTHSFYDGIMMWKGSGGNMGGATGTTLGSFSQFKMTAATNSAGAHTHSVTTVANTSGKTGSGTSFTNLPPYITVYMYKRVA